MALAAAKGGFSCGFFDIPFDVLNVPTLRAPVDLEGDGLDAV